MNRQLTTQNLTGTNELDKMKNIYDLETNNMEFTTSAFNNNIRRTKGGVYNYFELYGYFCPASHGDSNVPYYTYSNITSRQSLYIAL